MNRGILHLGRAAGLVAVLATAAACQIVGGIEGTSLFEGDGGPGGGDGGGTPSEFVVRGVAAGVSAPVALRLQLSGDTELLSVTQDGPFAFQTRLTEGMSYTVALEGQQPCVIDRAAGTIAGADGQIGLACNGAASLSDIILLGPSASDLMLMPGELQYTAEVSLLQQRIAITPMADPGVTITVAGMGVDSGMPSPPVPLALGDNEIEIVVEHPTGLRRTYRLTIRRAAKVAQYAYGKASNTEASDTFGLAMAMSGDTLAVAAPGEDSADTKVDGDQGNNSASASGAVYVFRRTPQGWEQEAYLKASNTDAGDQFGAALALSGDVLVVGAPGEDSGDSTNPLDDTAEDSGAAYVFRRSGSVWAQEGNEDGYLKASNIRADDRFGTSVALSGDTLAVGAPLEDSGATGVDGIQNDDSVTDAGAVYVFRHDGSRWVQDAYVKASNTDPGDRFGASVTLSSDTLAVGAPDEDSVSTGVGGIDSDNSATNSGAVYVFRRANGTWAQEAYIKASNVSANDRFGQSVSLSGDTLAVAAPFEDSAATGVNGEQANSDASDSGAVYAFHRAGATWTQDAYLKASNTAALDTFGQSVAIAGDVLAVGAYFEDSADTGVGGNDADDNASDSGAAYLFVRTGMGWAPRGYLKASNTGAGDAFGYSVAVSGDALVAGAPFEASTATGVGGDETNDGATNSGAVYVFH